MYAYSKGMDLGTGINAPIGDSPRTNGRPRIDLQGVRVVEELRYESPLVVPMDWRPLKMPALPKSRVHLLAAARWLRGHWLAGNY